MKPRALALLAAGLLSSVPVLAADAERGEELAWQYRCMTCHGDQGVSSDDRYPHLAGQQALYIVDRLKYFKAETEPFNHMNGQARPLSESEMQDLAAYFSEQRR